MTIDLVSLRRIMPRLQNAEDWLVPINTAAEEFGFSQKHRLAIFLANVAVETAELTRFVESFAYSAKRLMEVWPRRFDEAKAMAYAGHPEKIANEVYANRMGNGGPETGDGYRYRGRGTPMLTGKDAYGIAGNDLGVDFVEEPDLINETKEMAFRVGGHFWRVRGIEPFADDGDIRNVRKLWNGALIGYPEVMRYWRRANDALGVSW